MGNQPPKRKKFIGTLEDLRKATGLELRYNENGGGEIGGDECLEIFIAAAIAGISKKIHQRVSEAYPTGYSTQNIADDALQIAVDAQAALKRHLASRENNNRE